MNESFRRIISAVFFNLAIATPLNSAYAEIVTFYFEGPFVSGGYSDLGDFVTGSVSFDTSTPATSLSWNRKIYFGAVTSFSFSTNGVNGITRTFNDGDAQTWWDQGTHKLTFTLISPLLEVYYDLIAWSSYNMLTSLDLPTQPPWPERIDFFFYDFAGEFIHIASNHISWVRLVTVDMDIKPGNEHNVINPRSRGGIWVAVMSETDQDSPFDPSSQMDIPTVEFGAKGAKVTQVKVKDINKDGLGDLLLRFNIPETGIACGDIDVTLFGETFDGQSFTGTDSVKTVGCK